VRLGLMLFAVLVAGIAPAAAQPTSQSGTRQVEVPGRAVRPRSTADARRAVQTVSPIEVTDGDLARSYILWLKSRAPGAPMVEAAQHAIQGEWAEVEEALRREPDDTMVVRALRGLALFSREDYKGAAKALERARDAEPHSALTAFFLGWAHEGAGDSRAALRAWRTAARLDPSLVSAHLALADGYVRLSQPLLAVQALKAGLAALPTSPELLARLGQIERGGQH
jgi:tetratricopeptide (TPR) repeat protein